MSTQHTPGPWIGKDDNGKFNSNHEWSAQDEGSDCSEVAPIWANGKVIALVVHSSDNFSFESHPSIEANARMIAAAPDLLEALKYMLEVCPAINNQGEEAHCKARAAIAKAEGQQ